MSERWVKTRIRVTKYGGVSGGVIKETEEVRWINMAWVRMIAPSWYGDLSGGTAIVFGIRSEMNESHGANAILHVLDPPEHFLNGRPS